jgi:hypothetical protein
MINKPKMITIQNQTGMKPIVLSLIVLLSACDLYMGGITNTDVKMDCPPVLILPEAASITRYAKGAKRTILDVNFSGQITGIKGKCFYEFDPKTGEGTVEINVLTKFKMKRGAANRSQQANFQYFVSIVNNDGYILEKQIFQYSVQYNKNRTWAKDEDSPVELSIPLRAGKTGQDYTVYVGFQLSQEELELNRIGGSQ